MPLERSNIAMLLGLSGVVRSSENPLKMFVKCKHTGTWCCSRGVVGTFAKEKELELMFINLGKQERLFGVLRRLGWLLE